MWGKNLMQEIKVQLPQPLHLETPNLNNPSIMGGFTHNMNLNNSTINQPAINNGHANNIQLHNSILNSSTIYGGTISASKLTAVSLDPGSIHYQGKDLSFIIR